MAVVLSDMDDRLDTRRVRYFMQVLESGSVRGAAGALGMDPSAVSRAVSLLEQECGTALIERRGRGIAPTDAGALLATYLRRQHSEKQSLLAQMDSIRKIESGHIDIMAGEGYVDTLMEGTVCRFMRAHPKITIGLDVGSTNQIVQGLLEERIHIGLLFKPPNDERLRSHHSHPQPIQTWVQRSHPLAQIGRPLRLMDLLPYPGATVHRSFGVRQHIEAAEISEGVRLNVALTTASFDAVMHFVAAGLGYALVPRLTMAAVEPSRIVALPMKNALLYRGRSHVLTLRGRTLPPAAQDLLRLIVSDMKPRAAAAR
ncbi:LysR family transcriptional regulator [Bradyrhizobium sp. U87765 SZCCT0131]|uniref:LysR family transcriptional regulator n=1 Tax=unclassified Bradyrhizobium TaxID=2631580 RepID=UPI001BAB65CD|nr:MULTISPECIES: LysR family transcriptional regulator [unclassified Bradyrhizobium]MBR1222237.1 LysR family transcriptional regulator [Bradyrhizobium sp. U87765 SZCCT0131]MBR1264279.1 LysR family transcriptional regulator [Bradyrhizobium sp. U87765 SZCCT0134]MBR1307938.1 LysR family transcriptional regulator [Bradyrhizobium sp. U87765 SZCCT0110]MBR1320529.1 LysR family transcriptional regulator [Bradyrhizobium sp. U87765 SZCCT0109]MBR1348358.1 LysR family transcriptional regulator [Bradyrhizo